MYKRQILQSETFDRIVAVIDNKVITLRELDTYILLSGAQAGDESFRGKFLDMLIRQELLVRMAEEESVVVSQEEINQAVENAINIVKSQFPDEKTFSRMLRQYGWDERRLRREYSKIIEKQLFARKILQKHGLETNISEPELKKFYDRIKDSLPEIPAQIKFIGYMVPLTPGEEAQKLVYDKAKKIIDELKNGKSFSQLAEKYSQDIATRDRGGYIGWLSRTEVDTEFARVVFGLNPGEVTILTRGEAIHIIRCESKMGDEIELRDIVLIVTPLKSDSITADTIAERIKNLLEESQPLDKFEKYLISSGENFMPINVIPGGEEIFRLKEGEVHKFRFKDGILVAKLLEKVEPHIPQYEEVKPRLREMLIEMRAQFLQAGLLNKILPKVYIEKRL